MAITENVLRGQAKAAGSNAVCLSGDQLLAILDAVEGARHVARDCSDDEANWPALVTLNHALKRAFPKSE